MRKLLRGMVGMRPSHPELERNLGKPEKPAVLVAQLWARCRRLGRGSATWGYLNRDQAGVLTGIDMRGPDWRGPDWRGFSKQSDKSLFRLPGGTGRPARLAVCEASIGALSLAALEALRPDTFYVATTGGMGPLTLASLDALLRDLAGQPEAVLVAASDADQVGQHYAQRLAERAQAAGLRWERLVPPGGQNDWNDVCKRERRAWSLIAPGCGSAPAGGSTC